MADAEQIQVDTTSQVESEAPPGTQGESLDDEIEQMRKRVKELEEEEAKVKELQAQVEKQMAGPPQSPAAAPGVAPGVPVGAGIGAPILPPGSIPPAQEIPAGLDETSVYVGQVEYEASPEELQAHFQSCGTINRVTILCDKFTGKPKGYAYIEFLEKESVENALLLNESLFKGRQLKVTPKRHNIPGLNRGRGRGRRGGYRGRRGRGGYRGGFRGFYPGYSPYGAYGY